VFGFLPYWELATALESIDFDQLTTLAWFGVEAHPRGRMVRRTGSTAPQGWSGWESDAFRQIMAQAQQAGVRVVLTIERFSWTRAARRRTLTLLNCEAFRTRLAEDIVAEVTARGADGVNLDFEPLPLEVRDEFTGFVRDLRARLDAVGEGFQLTFDVTSDVTAYDLPALVADDAADAVLLMGYDYRVASASIAGSISPIDDPLGPDLRESMTTILSLAPPDRVILGLPWYGRAWSTQGSQPNSPTRRGARLPSSVAAWYDDALLVAREGGRQFDPVTVTAWTAYVRTACERCPETWRQLWYDDVDTFRAKAEMALAEGMRGVGIWALGYTGGLPDLWTALALAQGEVTDTVAPTGQAVLNPTSIRGQRDGLPIVGAAVSVDLAGADDPEGTGLAFVRLSNQATVDQGGQLVEGVTYPSVDVASWSLITGSTQQPPSRPTRRRPARPRATPAPTRRPARPVRRAIHVQWRDIAGNWSQPVALEVWFRPGAVPQTPTPTPSPSPGAGASPSPSAIPAVEPSPSAGP
jgi:spore germination protein YaaH